MNLKQKLRTNNGKFIRQKDKKLKHKNRILTTKEMVIFAMLASVMFLSKIMMEWLPNIHLLGVLTIVYTIVYRKKALYIIYTYVFLIGLTNGFATWWYPNLYTWLILWQMTFMIPSNWNIKTRGILYMLMSGVHGLAYGLMYMPFQAWVFGLNWQGAVSWYIAGVPFDVIHGISNFSSGILVIPLVKAVQKLNTI